MVGTAGRFVCPVCGYPGIGEPPWRDMQPSYEICPSCGVEYGYDDFATTPADLQARHRVLRERWKDAGCRWWNSIKAPPPGWDPASQLRTVEDDA